MDRRFPPPWNIDEANNACFIAAMPTSRRSAIFISRMIRGATHCREPVDQGRSAAHGGELR
jgi:hypothetical protein